MTILLAMHGTDEALAEAREALSGSQMTVVGELSQYLAGTLDQEFKNSVTASELELAQTLCTIDTNRRNGASHVLSPMNRDEAIRSAQLAFADTLTSWVHTAARRSDESWSAQILNAEV